MEHDGNHGQALHISRPNCLLKMEFYPTPSPSVQVTSNPGVVMQGGCGVQSSCCQPTCEEKKNVISTETIAIHTITNIILWSFAALVIGGTPAPGMSTAWPMNQDGQVQGKNKNKQTVCFCCFSL